MGSSWIATAALVLAGIAGSVPASADDLTVFKDWTIGCDQALTCTAFGVGSAEFEIGGYVVIRRDGGPDAVPAIEVVVPNDDGVTGPATLALWFDDAKEAELAAEVNDWSAYAVVPEADVSAVLHGLLGAKTLSVALSAGKSEKTYDVSLAGSSATLLRMDDLQGRVATVTALVKPGKKPASSVPAAPALPEVTAVRITDGPEDPGTPPAGVPAVNPDDCLGPPAYVEMHLGPDADLWGVCTSAGAYNGFYDFYVVRAGAVSPAVFPGHEPDDHGLVNPYVSEAGLLSAFAKGRGIGDCGEAAEYAWDGERFVVVSRAVMSDCRGVSSDDWPVVERAIVR